MNLQQNADILRDARVTQEEIDQAKQEELKINQEIERLQAEINALRYDELLKQTDLTATQREQLELKKKQLEEVEKVAKAEAMSLEQLLEKAGIEKEVMNMKLDGEQTLLDLLDANLDNEQKRKDILEKARGINENILNVNKKVSGISTKIATSVGLAADSSDTFLGGMVDIMASSDAIGENMKLTSLISKNLIGQSLNFKNILFSAVEFAYDLAKQIEKVSKDLGRATGFGNVFAQQIGDIGRNLTMIGGDEQAASEVIKTMADNISSFNPTSHRMNVNLATSVFKLKQFGVSTSTSTKLIDTFEKAMGLTSEQAVETTAQIAIMGRQLGITTEKMVGNFNTAYERITLFGSQGNSMFKELSAQVKATGLEMGKLLEISKKFDTFSGAADQVSQLNAVLGTNLSSLEMLNATDSERIEIIRREVRSSVGNFDSLGKYEKLYIQQAMGVSSVAEAQRLLNMSQSEYLSNQAKQQEAADAQAELAKNASELVPALTKLANILIMFFKLLTPFLSFFQGLGMLLDKIFSGIAEVTGGFEQAGYALYILIDVLTAATAAWYLFWAATTGPVGIAVAAVAGLGAIFDAFHRSGSPELWELPEHSGKAYDSMAESMGSATTAIGATTKSLDGLHGSFHSMGGSKIDLTAIAKMDTGKIAAGITSVKSALQELSTLKIDGFIAMTTDGNKSSFAVASEGVIKSLSEGRLTVDVNMPELKLPPIKVVVESKGDKLSDFIDARVEKRGTS